MKRWMHFLAVVAVLLGAAGIFGWNTWRKVFGPGARFAGDRIVLIPTGADFDQVVDSLNAQGLLTDERTFRLLAQRKKYPERVRPGRYKVAGGTSLNALVNKLRAGEQDPVKVTFTNVDHLPELAGRVARAIEPDSLTLLRAFLDPALQQEVGLTPATMISLFIPNTYEFWWTTTPQQFVARMRREHDAFWTEARRAKAAAHKLSPAEVATLASIVQAETVKMDDAPRIAGVYLNRLRIGMPLQADPTLKFAVGDRGIQRVLNVDKQVDSPYNTYKYTGLPPGPINMPEPRFIDAVLDAERHDYLYFCARADLSGYSEFSRTYEQHQVHAQRYRRALNARGIMR